MGETPGVRHPGGVEVTANLRTRRLSDAPCATCDAAIGDPCTSGTGRKANAHVPRLRAWWATWKADK